ncbi:hypothetical protein ABZ912_19790 [Nonomuraea angiospora]|uniref:hypothetical protein n=1 Tax=Nonomuraea angiospora TaxID=46172 RepID=UPI0033DDAC8B
MTMQDSAPPAEQTVDAVEHPIIAHLRARVEEADRRRVHLATQGGHARLAAQKNLEDARRFDDEALAAHAQVDTWQALLEQAQIEVAKEQRKIDAIRATVPTRAPDGALQPGYMAGRDPYPPMRYCNGCGTALRPATPDELAAAAAGQMLPDTQHECPTCYREAPEASVWSHEP